MKYFIICFINVRIILKKMKLETITVNGKEAKSSGVGNKFLIISLSLTFLLNGSVALWFLIYVQKNGLEKFIS